MFRPSLVWSVVLLPFSHSNTAAKVPNTSVPTTAQMNVWTNASLLSRKLAFVVFKEAVAALRSLLKSKELELTTTNVPHAIRNNMDSGGVLMNVRSLYKL